MSEGLRSVRALTGSVLSEAAVIAPDDLGQCAEAAAERRGADKVRLDQRGANGGRLLRMEGIAAHDGQHAARKLIEQPPDLARTHRNVAGACEFGRPLADEAITRGRRGRGQGRRLGSANRRSVSVPLSHPALTHISSTAVTAYTLTNSDHNDTLCINTKTAIHRHPRNRSSGRRRPPATEDGISMVEGRPDWAPGDVDVEVPSAARVYDYFLGGAHNFAVDRLLADEIARMAPNVGDTMRAGREFLRRAVRYLIHAGIRQFLDLGSGIPTVGNVHEIAQQLVQQARVVYVDIDPVAVAHSRAILEGNDRVAVLHQDVRQPGKILT